MPGSSSYPTIGNPRYGSSPIMGGLGDMGNLIPYTPEWFAAHKDAGMSASPATDLQALLGMMGMLGGMPDPYSAMNQFGWNKPMDAWSNFSTMLGIPGLPGNRGGSTPSQQQQQLFSPQFAGGSPVYGNNQRGPITIQANPRPTVSSSPNQPNVRLNGYRP